MKMPLIIKTPQELQEWRKTLPVEVSVGFVATMGALHLGHETLIKKSVAENKITVLSIFVNPTQFNDKKDLEKYPVTFESDFELASKNQVDVIFAPEYASMYPEGYRYKVVETEFSLKLCGKDRPGHFDGVLSVVMKLLNLVQPQRAYFGEKDYQQFSLIRDMARAFFLPYEIISVPTVREADGLAFSSRNVRLTPAQRSWAPEIHKAIIESTSAIEARQNLENAAAHVDYLEDIEGRRFAAVRLGEVRLIDNVEL
jgi:pantoate--beta-alanine ligase